MSESTSGMADLEQLVARHDERPEAQALLNALKRNQAALSKMLAKCDEGPPEAEDCIYRFYHGSRKVYMIQSLTEEIAPLLQQQMPDRPLNPEFVEILQQGTGLEPERRQPERRAKATRHMLEAYFHAHYFLEMAVKYGRELEYPPSLMPSGWAALLYLYNLR
ncbi:hypothetical protein U5801_15740 [Lamprobacter modestohalophilus]|uniref:hypothetical protein n=1 Tax=Lamprobacter modestohalophilus TaxID=1064514 RepID=UPI002ADEBC3D|nr:hypothetical protein [Lamprobacter modestohalophilus]MEA1051246.1 hypothetical protein [Lamprobacter modestohalophilus]